MTAQDQLRAMLREDIAPRLRAAGLRGTERRFSMPSSEFFAQIGIQSSVASTSDAVKFTANLQVINREHWMQRSTETLLPSRPSPNTGYAVPSSWQQRIGILMGVGDRWWWLNSDGADRGRIAAELGDALVSVGLPAMRDRMVVS